MNPPPVPSPYPYEYRPIQQFLSGYNVPIKWGILPVQFGYETATHFNQGRYCGEQDYYAMLTGAMVSELTNGRL